MNRKTLGVLATTALVAIASYVNAEITFDQKSAEGFCKEEFTKRGVLSQKHYDFCMERQTDAFAEAKQYYTKYSTEEPVELIENIVQYALNTYAPVGHKDYRFTLVAHYIQKQAEAFFDLQYDISVGAVKDGALAECKSKWLKRDEPDWNMVMYCLKDK